MPSLRPCIFCGRHDGLSKEHLWPEWMASYLPLGPHNAHISEVHSGIPKQSRTLQRRSERPGPVHTKKVRAVCRTCNNGWMSVVETEAKPVLLSALTEEALIVRPSESLKLSRWAVLKAIVGEHASNDHLTPYDDRSALRTERAIPPYFRVFAAMHRSQTRTAYARHSATLSLSIKGPAPPLPKGITRNVQITTLLVGPLCLHVTAMRVDDVSVTLLDPVRPMQRAHPDPDESTNLSAASRLSDVDIHLNAEGIDRIMRHPKVVFGGDLPG